MAKLLLSTSVLLIIAHQILPNPSVVDEYHTSPPIPMDSFLELFRRKVDLLLAKKIHPFFIFDGARHPLKHEEDDRRQKIISTAEEKLKEFYRSPSEEDYPLVEKQRKLSPKLRNDTIAQVVSYLCENRIRFIQAPFEAEWQQCYLLKMGLVDSIMTEDGDVFALGAKRWITRPIFETGDCIIIDSEMIQQQVELGQGRWKEHLGAFAVFSGCDYIHKLNALDIDATMEGYCAATDKFKFLCNLERENRWPPSANPDGKLGMKPASGFAELAQKVINLFKRAPIWNLVQVDSEVDIDTRDHSTFDVELCALDGSDVSDGNAWGKSIGFHSSPSQLLPGDGPGKFGAIASLRVWGRDGNVVTLLPTPRFCDHDGTTYDVPHGAIMDTNKIPLMHQTKIALGFFVRSHVPRVPKGMQRSRLLDLAKRILHLQQTHPKGAPKPVCLQEFHESHEHGTWSSIRSKIQPANGDSNFHWKGTNDTILAIRKMKMMNAMVIDAVFGTGKNGIRKRALSRLRGGHFDSQSLEVAHAQERSSGKPITVIRLLCTPSHKAGDYVVHLCFDADGNYLTTRYSRCECPAGLFFCSHLLGSLLVVYFIQTNPAWTSKEQIADALPTPIKSMRNVPVLFELCFGDDDVNRQARQHSKIGVEGETRRQGKGDKDEREEDENAEMDLVFEGKTSGDKSLDICHEAKQIVSVAEQRATILASEKAYEHKLCMEQIRLSLKRRLDDIGGPNEDIKAKLEQIEMLLSVEECVSKGLIPPSLLSHYVKSVKYALQRWRSQLRVCLMHKKGKRDVNWPAERLAKAPAGTRIVGDKGFTDLDWFYANMNPHLTPHRLRDQSQFTPDEMVTDQVLKSRRWSSESNFRRVDEVGILQDRISRKQFSHLPDAVDFAHGRQNMIGMPFYGPDDRYFTVIHAPAHKEAKTGGEVCKSNKKSD